MTTRRDFLKAGTAAVATGIVFCGCGLKHSAHAQQSTRQTLPVTVGGKRVKTIDVHAHCHFREAGALLGAEAAAVQLPPVNGAAEAFIEIDKRLAAMDAQAVDLEVLSINPYWYCGPRSHNVTVFPPERSERTSVARIIASTDLSAQKRSLPSAIAAGRSSPPAPCSTRPTRRSRAEASRFVSCSTGTAARSLISRRPARSSPSPRRRTPAS